MVLPIVSTWVSLMLMLVVAIFILDGFATDVAASFPNAI